MKLINIMKRKGSQVHTVQPEESVQSALSKLNRHNIGALLVVDGKRKIEGIISERDLMLHIGNTEEGLSKTSVRELMTPRERLIVATEDDELEYAMNIMTKNRVRHLPIIAEGQLSGILSIGDVVKSLLSDKKQENKMLHDYIVGRYPA